MVTTYERCTTHPRADPEREQLHLVHVKSKKSNARHLRNELRAWGVNWEEIPGCNGWIQAELNRMQVLQLAMAFPRASIDILD